MRFVNLRISFLFNKKYVLYFVFVNDAFIYEMVWKNIISTKQKLVFPILIMSWNPRHYPPAFGDFIASLALELPKEVTWFFLWWWKIAIHVLHPNLKSCVIPCSDLKSCNYRSLVSSKNLDSHPPAGTLRLRSRHHHLLFAFPKTSPTWSSSRGSVCPLVTVGMMYLGLNHQKNK